MATIAELKTILDRGGMTYNKSAKKADLQALVDKLEAGYADTNERLKALQARDEEPVELECAIPDYENNRSFILNDGGVGAMFDEGSIRHLPGDRADGGLDEEAEDRERAEYDAFYGEGAYDLGRYDPNDPDDQPLDDVEVDPDAPDLLNEALANNPDDKPLQTGDVIDLGKRGKLTVVMPKAKVKGKKRGNIYSINNIVRR